MEKIRVDLNSASADEIRQSCDVGPSTAETLVKNRPFRDMDEIGRIPGVGQEIVEKLKAHGCMPAGQ